VNLSTTFDFRPYQDWLDFILNQTDPPLVISTSYGEGEQTGALQENYEASFEVLIFIDPTSS